MRGIDWPRGTKLMLSVEAGNVQESVMEKFWIRVGDARVGKATCRARVS